MEKTHTKILLIEDERPLALVISRFLSEAGWGVGWVSNGAKGLDVALKDDFALVLLDVNLPGMNGWDVCREIRAKKPWVPIIMLTAMDELEDKVRAFHLGADDFIAKPFELAELEARVESVIRRSTLSRDLVTRVADLELDRKTRRVTRRGREIRLNRREYDLLEALASNEGSTVDRETLQRRVWTDDEAFGKSVDIFMTTLKQKVDVPFGKELLKATPNGGYMLGYDQKGELCLGCDAFVA